MKNKVLIIDDDADLISVLRERLKNEGFDVIGALNGEEGVRLAFSQKPDLILLDIMLPDINGREVFAEIKKSSNFDHVPIIFLTARNEVVNGLGMGAVDFVQKPFNGAELTARIKAHLKIKKLQDEYRKLSITDDLTGCYNRRHADKVLGMEIERARRYSLPLSCVMMDLDNFREINDTYGHALGDNILREAVSVITNNIRKVDYVSRYGGDEFLLILPHTKEEGALVLCNRMIGAFSAHTFKKESVKVKVSISLGIVSFSAEETRDVESFVKLADKALYHAKKHDHISCWSNIEKSAGALIKDEENIVKKYKNVINKIALSTESEFVSKLTPIIEDIDKKDGFTKSHSVTVSNLAERIAREIKLPESQITAVKNAGLVHDIGKIGIPEEILKNEGKYTRDEYEIMKRHPFISWKILSHVRFMDKELPIILSHHESYDGKGYPEKIKGNMIPIGARIIAVADAYEAMMSDRPHRQKMSIKAAVKELENNKGKQFDPLLVDVCVEIIMGGNNKEVFKK